MSTFIRAKSARRSYSSRSRIKPMGASEDVRAAGTESSVLDSALSPVDCCGSSEVANDGRGATKK